MIPRWLRNLWPLLPLPNLVPAELGSSPAGTLSNLKTRGRQRIRLVIVRVLAHDWLSSYRRTWHHFCCCCCSQRHPIAKRRAMNKMNRILQKNCTSRAASASDWLIYSTLSDFQKSTIIHLKHPTQGSLFCDSTMYVYFKLDILKKIVLSKTVLFPKTVLDGLTNGF